ncbi:MAG: hypothetical protein ACXVJT_14445 [Thermoanaerobaculia bacterium]
MTWNIFALAGLLIALQAPPSPTCSLHRVADHWQGSCGALIEGKESSVTIKQATAIASGIWKKGEKPRSVWSGTITTSEYPATPIEIEVYADRHGAMRTIFGWFPVSDFSEASDVLRLAVDASREVKPSSIDRAIVERAAKILSSDAAWNRADTRKCPADATTWSIYCAMEKATIEVSGAFHHRRPALQVVREIVDERTAGRPYEHRLMDYNNDSTTRLEDVQSLYAEGLKRIDADIE